ncbi:MAG: sensor histidine kinase [Bacteroidota bacterium]
MLLRPFRQLFSFDFQISQENGDADQDNILVRKGNQLHEIIIYMMVGYSVLFTGVNFFNGSYREAYITLSLIPLSLITIILYRSGYTLLSKLWNIVQVSVILGLLCLTTSPATGILSFFAPSILGCMITLQGKERIYGYLGTGYNMIVVLFLATTDLRIGEMVYTEERLHKEWIMNFIGASVATTIELLFIMLLTNKIQEKMLINARQLNLRNEDLTKANTELDNFVYRVSHDLRSPLLSVKGLLALVFVEPGLDRKTEGYLRMADKSINRLDETIREILEYSRNSRLSIRFDYFNIRKMTEGIFEDLKYLASPEFRFSLEIHGADEICSDGYRINTVLRNIVSNSVKYQRRDIPDPNVSVVIRHSALDVLIEVKDNGTGIHENSLPRVFDMFYRGNSNQVGTGLGLYICKEVLNKLGGTIKIRSEVNKGTVVNILFPKQPNPTT